MNYASHNTNTFSLRGIVIPTLCGAAERIEGPEEVAYEHRQWVNQRAGATRLSGRMPLP